MKFDTVIIGGGLSGLMCGIRLQSNGARCAIVSTGQSALHFWSGSFDLLNRLPDGTPVELPEKAVGALPAGHPYARLGKKFAHYAHIARETLAQCGVTVRGEMERNHLHFTPMGTLKPTWLTSSDFNTYRSAEELRGQRIRILNFAGFLDFNTAFVAEALESCGAQCTAGSLSIAEIDRLRTNPTEMRAVHIARVLDRPEVFGRFLEMVKRHAAEADIVVVPALFGLDSEEPVRQLREAVPAAAPIPTMPPSVAGIRTQQQLRRAFERLGGLFMPGDTAIGAEIREDRVRQIRTANHGEVALQADNYVLASGSFFSKGLVADMTRIAEPLFDLDVAFDTDRTAWYDPHFFLRQNYITYGVAVDEEFRARKQGRTIENLYVTGSVLGGFDPIREGCGAGVAMLTALHVADKMK